MSSNCKCSTYLHTIGVVKHQAQEIYVWMQCREFMRKKIVAPRFATIRYRSAVLLMEVLISFPSLSLADASRLCCFALSSPSMSARSSVMSPSAVLNFTRISSSSCLILTLNSFAWWMTAAFLAARSGRSFLITRLNNWSSSPRGVTVKFTSVSSACNSGG